MSGAPRGLHGLRHEETQIGDRVRSVSFHKIVATSQALHEVVTGVGCPGADRMLFKAHEHVRTPTGDQGIPLPRNALYSLDFGSEITKGNGLSWGTGFSSWYKPHNGSEVVSVNASGTRITTNPANFRVFVTPGIDSDKTAISTQPCYLNAEFLVSNDTQPIDYRIYNRTIDQIINSVNVSAYTTSLTIIQLKIPCEGGKINELDIEAYGTGGTVTVHQGFIAERRFESQPATSGTTAYTASTRP